MHVLLFTKKRQEKKTKQLPKISRDNQTKAQTLARKLKKRSSLSKYLSTGSSDRSGVDFLFQDECCLAMLHIFT